MDENPVTDAIVKAHAIATAAFVANQVRQVAAETRPWILREAMGQRRLERLRAREPLLRRAHTVTTELLHLVK